jgi:hypothetical protein
VRTNFDQLNCFDIFKTLGYEIDTYYGAKIKWHNKKMELLDIRNEVISLIKDRLISFLKWFINCQKVCLEDMKQPPIQPDKSLDKKVLEGLFERIEEIVDSEREYHLIKSLVNGKSNRSPRLCRMIAVCWVLVNRFSCIIKGGFVRDWIVNGKD